MKYTPDKTAHGVVLLVTPADFAQRANTTKYHLYAASYVPAVLGVPALYVEGDTLYAHELWPFKLAELPPEAGSPSRVVALCGEDMRRLVSSGYTKFAAGKIKGE